MTITDPFHAARVTGRAPRRNRATRADLTLAIARALAPQGFADVVLKTLAMLTLFNAVNMAVVLMLRGTPYHVGVDLVQMTLVALPFVGMIQYATYNLSIAQEGLRRAATTDPLTGLPNRRAFADAVAAAGRGVLLLLDADHFKRVNDTRGHGIGDLCLRAIADRLVHTTRPEDLVARMGGEEFAVFLPGAPRDTAMNIANRLCRPIRLEPEEQEPLVLTLSAGGTVKAADEPLDMASDRADRALYAAKAAGRARAVMDDSIVTLSR